MTRRRALLSMIAIAMLIADGAFLLWRWHIETAANAVITYAGIDSASLVVPAGIAAPVLRNGRWYLGTRLVPDLRTAPGRPAGLGKAVLVSLGPSPTYDQAIRSIRDLKARGMCNVWIREGGMPIRFNGRPDEQLDMQGLFLCGKPMGDVGSFDAMPPDGPIHTD